MDLKQYYQNNHPTIIGVLSALTVGFIIYFIGNISGNEAKYLITESIDNFNMLCNTVTLACATILGLLLTALGTSRASETNIKEKHYQGIIHVTTVVTYTFIASLFVFLLMLTPFTESENIPASYLNNFYWIMLVVNSILVGLTITIGLMLRKLIINITKVTALQVDEHELIMDEDNEEDEELKEEVQEDQKVKDEENSDN